MKILYLVNRDGTRWAPSAPVPDDFDTQAWANKRRRSLKLIGVVRVEEQPVPSEREKNE